MRIGWTAAVLLVAACAGRPEATPSSATSGTPETATAPVTERIVVDVREPALFAAGHAPGALNLQLTWKQLPDRLPVYVPDSATPLAIHAANAGEWEAASAIFEEQGYVDYERFTEPVAETLSLVTAKDLRQRLIEPDPPVILDVRTPEEWQGEVIEGAIQVLASEAPSILDDLDPELEYVVICEGGVRSSQLASLLAREGFERVSNVIDGMWAWRNLPD